MQFSPDGTKVVYESTSGRSEIYVRDLGTGVVTKVSTTATGGAGVGSAAGQAATDPYFSPDGKYVVFATPYELNGANNAHDDVYVKVVKDANGAIITNGAVFRVSTSTTGGGADNDSGDPQFFGADGSKVLFVGYASNLVPNDTNGFGDVFIRTIGD